MGQFGIGSVRPLGGQDGKSSEKAQKQVAELKERFQVGAGNPPYTDSISDEVLKTLNQRERDSLDIQYSVLQAPLGK